MATDDEILAEGMLGTGRNYELPPELPEEPEEVLEAATESSEEAGVLEIPKEAGVLVPYSMRTLMRGYRDAIEGQAVGTLGIGEVPDLAWDALEEIAEIDDGIRTLESAGSGQGVIDDLLGRRQELQAALDDESVSFLRRARAAEPRLSGGVAGQLPSLAEGELGQSAINRALDYMEAPGPYGISQAEYALHDAQLRQVLGDDAYVAFRELENQTQQLRAYKGLSTTELTAQLEAAAKEMMEGRAEQTRVEQMASAGFMEGDKAQQTIDSLRRDRKAVGYRSVRNVAEKFLETIREAWPGGQESMPEAVSQRLESGVARIVKRIDSATEAVFTDEAGASRSATKAMNDLNELMRDIGEQATSAEQALPPAPPPRIPAPEAPPPGGWTTHPLVPPGEGDPVWSMSRQGGGFKWKLNQRRIRREQYGIRRDPSIGAAEKARRTSALEQEFARWETERLKASPHIDSIPPYPDEARPPRLPPPEAPPPGGGGRPPGGGVPPGGHIIKNLTPAEARWFNTMGPADLEMMAENGMTRMRDGSIRVADMDRAYRYIDDMVISHMSDAADVRPPPSFWRNTFLNKAVEAGLPEPPLSGTPGGRDAAIIDEVYGADPPAPRRPPPEAPPPRLPPPEAPPPRLPAPEAPTPRLPGDLGPEAAEWMIPESPPNPAAARVAARLPGIPPASVLSTNVGKAYLREMGPVAAEWLIDQLSEIWTPDVSPSHLPEMEQIILDNIWKTVFRARAGEAYQPLTRLRDLGIPENIELLGRRGLDRAADILVERAAKAATAAETPASASLSRRTAQAGRGALRATGRAALAAAPFELFPVLEAIPLTTPRGPVTGPLMRTAGEGSSFAEERAAERGAGRAANQARLAEEEFWRTHTVDLNQLTPAERVRYDSWQKQESEIEEMLQRNLFSPGSSDLPWMRDLLED